MTEPEIKTEQARYYARTSVDYDRHHVSAGDEHYIALEYTAGIARMFNCKSVLDVGAGTGRSLDFLSKKLNSEIAVGIEPVAELRAQALGDVRDGDGEALPFAENEFDVVVATGVMHHVADPSLVLGEMMRVARVMVVVSDSNRFGQGRPVARLAKVLLFKMRMWTLFDRLRTRGRGHMESIEDGIFYSYSVYDSKDQLAAWATRAFVIPTTNARSGPFGDVTESSHGLLVGVREPTGAPGWAGH